MIRILLLTLALGGCSTAAEFERPEDTTLVRASYTEAGILYSWFTGGTTVCQITALDVPLREGETREKTAAQLLADYQVALDEDGCVIVHKDIQ